MLYWRKAPKILKFTFLFACDAGSSAGCSVTTYRGGIGVGGHGREAEDGGDTWLLMHGRNPHNTIKQESSN